MPTPPQRRNVAYLNRGNSRFGPLGRAFEDLELPPGPDLRLISGARSSGASDARAMALPTWTDRILDCAARSKGELRRRLPDSANDLRLLTVELSGA